ncbi:MAG: hypothetical protein ACI4MY_06430, partial [Christensenellales bacterium]
DPEEGLSTQVIFEKPVAVTVGQGEVDIAPIVGVANTTDGDEPNETADAQNNDGVETVENDEQTVEKEVTVEVDEKNEE